MDSDFLEADYVIVGAGASGMAFADALLTGSDATLLLLDRRARPGGHWNDAYSFVRLHAPATHYGVNSLALGSGRRERGGLNDGLLELSSRAEILGYYDRVLHDRLLPSGRVTFLPFHDYDVATGQAVCLADGRRRIVRARRRVVDATLADTRVPATHPPAFDVSPGVTCVPPNALPDLPRLGRPFVVTGAGKTAIDTVLWLLEREVDPDSITWVRPRDPWLLDRARVQTDPGSFERTVGGLAQELEAAAAACSIDDLFVRLEEAGALQRIDRTVVPTMYRCATASRAEVAQLGRVERVVRLGRITAIEPDRIHLTGGTVATPRPPIHVHCTADGIAGSPPRPVFETGRIALQYVRRCSPSFSAALIAQVETLPWDDDQKNAACNVVPLPRVPLDWLRMAVADARNALAWSRTPALRDWLATARLNPIGRMLAEVAPTPSQAMVVARYRQAVGPGVTRLAQLLAENRATHPGPASAPTVAA